MGKNNIEQPAINDNFESDIEQRLFTTLSLDDLIKKKMEEEIKAEFAKQDQKQQTCSITDINKVPEDLVFSKKTVFKMFNRMNKTQTYINGLQAEAMLGLQNSIRDKIKQGKLDAFSTEDAYIKFEKFD